MCTATTDALLDNALVGQKDQLLAMLQTNRPTTDWLVDANRVYDILMFNRALWFTLSYGYKFREIMERICTECWAAQMGCCHVNTLNNLEDLRRRCQKAASPD